MNTKTGRGFTLIELMMVIVITAILASVAIPSFSDMLARNTITTDANDLLSSILLARSEAVKREQDVRFIAGPGMTSWQVAAETTAGSNTFDDVLLQHTRDANSLSTIASFGAVATINFNSRGRATMATNSDYFTITIAMTDYQYRSCILFSANGRPTVVKYSDNPMDVCTPP